MQEPFQPAQIAAGDVFRVRQTFYASGAAVQAGWVVKVLSVNTRVEDRVFDLTIHLLRLDPPGGSILWGRSHLLDQAYLMEIFERVDK